MDLLKTLGDQFKGRVPICAHGTDELPEHMWGQMIATGVSKVSLQPLPI
jgi:fructose-bisphosphate aldolase class II